jgi:hypothetical protein
MSAWLLRHRYTLLALGALLALPLVAHAIIGWLAKLTPPEVEVPEGRVERPTENLRTFGEASVRKWGKLTIVRLSGTPEQIGFRHVRLLYDEMVENEGVLLGLFEQRVKNSLFRTALLDLAQLRYRGVDRAMTQDRLREIAAGALAFQPDPYAHFFTTYQRFVYLNALYDISLSFEHSPLIGCTTFALRGRSVKDGKTLLARAFDFDVHPVFDEQKAVFFVREKDRIPFASVAWPGLVGVVSGMNAEGVAVVVHGGRAGEVRTRGEPVVHALRRVLSTARTTAQAVEALRAEEPMVSHIVVVADGAGKTAAVERVPGRAPYMHWLPERAVVTNHFEGAAADDPRNARVRAETSTLARRRRGEQLLDQLKGPVTPEVAVRLLRDRRGVNGTELELGDRNAIDALIATHGVVFEPTRRVLWVSESPHLLGRFVAFELERFLAPDYDAGAAFDPPVISADPLLRSGEFDKRNEPAKRTSFSNGP